jgi:hypothetical protein
MSPRTHPRIHPHRHAWSGVPAALAVALVLTLTGCGSDDSGDSAGSTVHETSTAPDDSGGSATPSDSERAVSVSYRQTGGLKGVDVQKVYSEDGPPPEGTSAAEVDQVLAAASDPALQDADLKKVPKYPCCDLQEYTVTVTYADGSSQTFRTVDGLQQPAVFEDLLRLLA